MNLTLSAFSDEYMQLWDVRGGYFQIRLPVPSFMFPRLVLQLLPHHPLQYKHLLLGRSLPLLELLCLALPLVLLLKQPYSLHLRFLFLGVLRRVLHHPLLVLFLQSWGHPQQRRHQAPRLPVQMSAHQSQSPHQHRPDSSVRLLRHQTFLLLLPRLRWLLLQVCFFGNTVDSVHLFD